MVKVIMGVKGSGKTKELVRSINEAVKTEAGSMVCIEKGNKLTYDIDYRVRLVDVKDYQVSGATYLKGFISGLHAGNFDITHIFIDSLYKIIGEDIEAAEAFLQWCEVFGEANQISFTVVISDNPDKASDHIKKYF